MPGEYLQGQESITGGSLESKPTKIASPVLFDFRKEHMSETSLENSNPKKKRNAKAPLTAEEQNCEQKACLKDFCDMVGTSYSTVQLAESSYTGRKRKSNRREFNKKGVFPSRIKKIWKSVSKNIKKHMRDSKVQQN